MAGDPLPHVSMKDRVTVFSEAQREKGNLCMQQIIPWAYSSFFFFFSFFFFAVCEKLAPVAGTLSCVTLTLIGLLKLN